MGGIIDNALHLLAGVGSSYLTVLIKGSNVGGMGLSECACMRVRACLCVCITMLMRTIIFPHLESISCDYDDGLSYPYYYQD